LKFVGVVPNDRVVRVVDVYVHLPLWDEPFGIVLAKAMACGLAVVSTRVGGTPEIVAMGVRRGFWWTPMSDHAEALVRLLVTGAPHHE
jgi:glycosyltransferase involved in cell wall biosynthesis